MNNNLNTFNSLVGLFINCTLIYYILKIYNNQSTDNTTLKEYFNKQNFKKAFPKNGLKFLIFILVIAIISTFKLFPKNALKITIFLLLPTIYFTTIYIYLYKTE